jgi:hypothetical protein
MMITIMSNDGSLETWDHVVKYVMVYGDDVINFTVQINPNGDTIEVHRPMSEVKAVQFNFS